MSVDTSHPQGTPEVVEPQDEALPVGKIVAVAIVSLVAFALGILWTVGIMTGVEDDNERQFGPHQTASEIGKAEIGMVDQTLFNREKRAAVLAQDKLRRLENAGWVSRSQGIVHIPIGEAMKAVAQGRRPVGAGTSQTTLQPAPIPGVPIAPTPPTTPVAPDSGTGGATPTPQQP